MTALSMLAFYVSWPARESIHNITVASASLSIEKTDQDVYIHRESQLTVVISHKVAVATQYLHPHGTRNASIRRQRASRAEGSLGQAVVVGVALRVKDIKQ